MSSTPIKKQPIGFIFLLFIYPSVPLGAAFGESRTFRVEPGSPGIRIEFGLVLCAPTCNPIGGGLTWGLSPNNGTATLTGASEADDEGRTWFELDFNANACGTYTVSVRLTRDSRPANIHFIISGKPSCSTAPSGGTPSPPPSPESTIPPPPLITTPSTPSPPPPPPSSKLVKISDDNQVTIPGDNLKFIVELRDLDGSPIPDVDVNFFIFSGDKSRASLNPASAMTDANGRARTTLTLATDAAGEYTVEAYRNDKSNVYTLFTVTVDPLHRKATRLEKISGDNQQEPPGTALENPFVVEVRDQADKPLQGVNVTFSVASGGGTLSAITAITDSNGSGREYPHVGSESRNEYCHGGCNRYSGRTDVYCRRRPNTQIIGDNLGRQPAGAARDSA